MRNELTQLTEQIDQYNGDMARMMTELRRLMNWQEEIIQDGTRMGLKKTSMLKMLACVKVKFAGPSSHAETPLGDVLQEFPADGLASEQIDATARANRVLADKRDWPQTTDETAASLDTFRAVGFDLSKVAE